MANFIVTNNNDSGVGSLRQAILDANQLEGADRIEVSGNITLTSAIDITDSVSIVNVGKTKITQTGNDRLFSINDGDAEKLSKVNFVGISMTGGNAQESGGAIFSQENIGIFNSKLFGNVAGDRGGAVYVEGATLNVNRTNIVNNQARTGGGVALAFDSQGTLANSKVSGNTASSDGGGVASIYGSQLELFKSEISGNTAREAGGISAYYNSSVKLARTTVSGNTAKQSGGGIGAAYFSQVESVGSTISDNTASKDGGISIASSSLKAIDSKISGNKADSIGGIGISYYSQAEIIDSNISGNTAVKADAGGINASYGSSLKLANSSVSDNLAAQFAGGINLTGSQAEITNSTITGNKAKASGGINLAEGSSLSLVESQISGNKATKFQAGGIGISDSSQAEITNSKISFNVSRQGEGGGINVAQGGSLKLDNTSVIKNRAADSGGGINLDDSSQAEIAVSSIAKNEARIGGGINLANDSSLKLANTSVEKNVAADAGGGINVDFNSVATITNGSVANNEARIGGGINVTHDSSLKLAEISVVDNVATDFGGGINVLFNSQLEINNGTVAGNAAPQVGGINIANGSSGKLTNSSVNDNVAEISGGGINVYFDSQLETFNTTITGNTNGGVQSYGENNTVTLIETSVTDNSVSNLSGDGITEIKTQILEAEDITDFAGYRLESNSLASGGQLLSLAGENQNEVGTANFNFTGATGTYTVKIGTYDENDGAATIQLAQQGDAIGSVVLDRNSGSSGIATDTQVTRVIAANIQISQGDSFTLTGFEDGNEHARIDFIEFEAVGEGEAVINSGDTSEEDLTPIPAATISIPTSDLIRWEAEAADSLIGYRTENLADASGGSVLSFVGEAQGEFGSASFTIQNSGTYDVLLAAYDENDGEASFNLELNGSQIGDTLVLNNDLGSNVANAQTAVSETIALGISLEVGDVLTVNGFEQGSEHARLDYLELIPTETVETF